MGKLAPPGTPGGKKCAKTVRGARWALGWRPKAQATALSADATACSASRASITTQATSGRAQTACRRSPNPSVPMPGHHRVARKSRPSAQAMGRTARGRASAPTSSQMASPGPTACRAGRTGAPAHAGARRQATGQGCIPWAAAQAVGGTASPRVTRACPRRAAQRLTARAANFREGTSSPASVG